MSDYEAVHTYETVLLERSGGAARVTLNRPEVMNAWNRDFGVELLDALKRCSADEEIRAVTITGAGRGFSSGADLRGGFEPNEDGRPNVYDRLTQVYHPIFREIRGMPKPVLAAVNGAAVGIGCSLALACDLIVAAESSYFLLAFVNIGLVPDGGSSVFVPARAGAARAFEMAMLGERVPAALAVAWGLANRVVPDDDFQDEVEALSQRLAAGPTKSYAGTKRQLNNRIYAGMDDQLELEATIQQEMANSGDFAEGVMAFLEKRSPDFQGA